MEKYNSRLFIRVTDNKVFKKLAKKDFSEFIPDKNIAELFTAIEGEEFFLDGFASDRKTLRKLVNELCSAIKKNGIILADCASKGDEPFEFIIAYLGYASDEFLFDKDDALCDYQERSDMTDPEKFLNGAGIGAEPKEIKALDKMRMVMDLKDKTIYNARVAMAFSDSDSVKKALDLISIFNDISLGQHLSENNQQACELCSDERINGALANIPFSNANFIRAKTNEIAGIIRPLGGIVTVYAFSDKPKDELFLFDLGCGTKYYHPEKYIRRDCYPVNYYCNDDYMFWYTMGYFTDTFKDVLEPEEIKALHSFGYYFSETEEKGCHYSKEDDVFIKYTGSDDEVTVKDGTEIIYEYAFYRKKIKKADLPDSVRIIEKCAFDCCEELETIRIPAGLTEIENYAFNGCKALSSVTLPDGLEIIGYSAFSNCRSLSEITIPESVKKIGASAFFDCWTLKDITIPGGVSEIGPHAFYSCKELTIHAPAGSYAEQYAKENNIKFEAIN